MTYQIPQQLEYKEKIIFGLTFKQLIFAFIFGFFSLLFFKKIENEILGFIFASIPLFIGICFVFFNFYFHIKNYWSYIKSRKMIKGDKKLEKFIGIKDIKNDFIITSKNKKVAVLKIMPINFSIKQTIDKDAIIKSFQKFLNSLDFSTQIIMNTESIKLDDYLSSLKSKIHDKTFLGLFEDYKKHLHDTISNSKIMNRVFYLVIPEKDNIEIQTDICIDRLRSLNLKIKKLDSRDL